MVGMPLIQNIVPNQEQFMESGHYQNATKKDRLLGCILGGAIGDAWGSAYENDLLQNNSTTFYLGKADKTKQTWSFTDDTQLTLVSLEALIDHDKISPQLLASAFVRNYTNGKITGIGASTLKAFQELQVGGHWSQVGRSGEYAAGNGAAMRIAPFAFWEQYARGEIRDFCRITHRNDEAYTGALAVVLAIREILAGHWVGDNNLIELLIPELPDTNVRDRLIELNKLNPDSIAKAAKLGVSGYVVNSIPFAIFSASQVKKIGIEEMFKQIIECGGDTDTNASIGGQIAGTLLGRENILPILIDKLKTVSGYEWVDSVIKKVQAAF
jgi:ADP-ribosylglycohydrolase